jgi:hypothetical protein
MSSAVLVKRTVIAGTSLRRNSAPTDRVEAGEVVLVGADEEPMKLYRVV